MEALENGFGARIGLRIQPLMRVPVAREEPFQAKNIDVTCTADNNGSTGTRFEKADAAKDQRAHDALT